MADIIQTEANFHDKWADEIDVTTIIVDDFFSVCTAPENKWIIEKLGNVKNKKILDLGCGAGEAAVFFAKKGALSAATDVSPGMLNVVKKLAKEHNVNVETKQILDDKLPFEDSSFDIVYAANLFHHVDLEKSLQEIKRILKKGGTLVSWDPLAHNPAINVYRKMASSVRTEDEHPLTMSQTKLFNKYFSNVEKSFTWFFTLFIFMKFYLIDGVNPNEERYWKKIIIEHEKLSRLYGCLNFLDKIILTIFPFLKRYCWNVVVYARK